jgi:hypothetical protein
MKIILAKVQNGDFYADLVRGGFQSGIVFNCPRCECQYRAFYSEPESVAATAAHALSFETAIEREHPEHSEARLSL